MVVGGSPAGSSCAWKLKQNKIETIVLDKKTFPGLKVCAGWITPKVLKDLELEIENYPRSILTFKKLHFSFRGKKFAVRTRQYSIRRYEFESDHAFITGDAAGLATLDMGEGIGPAVESGILAAKAIIHGSRYSLKSVKKHSFTRILIPWLK